MDEIKSRFTEVPATQEMLDKLHALSQAAEAYTRALREHAPPSRERAVAETNAETAAMWASKAVTHNQPKS